MKDTLKVYATENFRVERIKKGYTITKLAELLNVSKTAIGQFERRVNGISPEKSKQLLDILGVDFDDVFELVERGA